MCLFTRSTFTLECKYFRTKQGLLVECSILKNTTQWKMFLKDVGLPLLLFRMCEFMHTSSFTFPGGFPSIYRISKIIRLQRTTGQKLIKWQCFELFLIPFCFLLFLLNMLWTSEASTIPSTDLLALLCQLICASSASTTLRTWGCPSIHKTRVRVKNLLTQWSNDDVQHFSCSLLFLRKIHKTCMYKHRNISWWGKSWL